jgi:hypothetical protein
MRRLSCFLLLFACSSRSDFVTVSGDSPLDTACELASGDTLYRSSEVEPSLAIDPLNPKHFAAAWQQDRYSGAAAAALISAYSFDGGHTWKRSSPAFTACSGGTFQRATDPWISFAPDGTLHFIGFGLNTSDATKAMLASRSKDGGATWSAPIALQTDTDADFEMDKQSITADSNDAHYVYAVWDRLTGQNHPDSPGNRGPTWFARSTDGGQSWETARAIYDPGDDAQTISNQIVSLPDGTLLDLANILTQNSTPDVKSNIAVLRSSDKGATWSAPVIISDAEQAPELDPRDGRVIRGGNGVPDIAVDPQSGAAYAVWEDARFSGLAVNGIALSRSTDSGLTWSPPVQVNGEHDAHAFTPMVDVAAGVVGVSYYDLRDDPGQGAELLTAHWLARSTDSGQTFADSRDSPPFDLQTAPFSSGYFLGDYQGLAHAGADFLSLFVVANSGNLSNRTDVVFRPLDFPPLSPSVSLVNQSRQLLARATSGKKRWRRDATRH